MAATVRTDIAMSVKVSRSLLGLADLEINDHLTYYVAADFMGAQVSWQREQVDSAFLDGSVTVRRSRQMVQEPITIEVLGKDAPTLNTNLQALVQAFIQDSFTITNTMDKVVRQYDCEAADYTLSMINTRFAAKQVQVKFNVLRRPVLVGGLV